MECAAGEGGRCDSVDESLSQDSGGSVDHWVREEGDRESVQSPVSVYSEQSPPTSPVSSSPVYTVSNAHVYTH